jgi:hypothetical protein
MMLGMAGSPPLCPWKKSEIPGRSMARCGHGTVYPTVLAAAISDLEGMAAVCGYEQPRWLTITPFCELVGVPRQTMIGRLSSWYAHCNRSGYKPWTDPLVCPIYRRGSLPGLPRRGRPPGCWLLDATRERAIWIHLRNFSRWSDQERRRKCLRDLGGLHEKQLGLACVDE